MNVTLFCQPRLSSMTVADLAPGDLFRPAALGVEPRAWLLTDTSRDGEPQEDGQASPRRHVCVDIGTGQVFLLESIVNVINLTGLDGDEIALADATGIFAPHDVLGGIITP